MCITVTVPLFCFQTVVNKTIWSQMLVFHLFCCMPCDGWPPSENHEHAKVWLKWLKYELKISRELETNVVDRVFFTTCLFCHWACLFPAGLIAESAGSSGWCTNLTFTEKQKETQKTSYKSVTHHPSLILLIRSAAVNSRHLPSLNT